MLASPGVRAALGVVFLAACSGAAKPRPSLPPPEYEEPEAPAAAPPSPPADAAASDTPPPNAPTRAP